MSKAALCKARLKIKYEAFVELNHHLIDFFYRNFSFKTWCGHRLVAFDGSTLRLPSFGEIPAYFGVWGSNKGEPCPMARVSQMFDPLNKITLEAIISPKSTGERDLAIQHCMALEPNDLALLDRGYPAFWLFKLILSRQANFCARIQCKKWKVVKKFFYSNLWEKVIELPCSPTSIAKCKKLGLDLNPIKLRLIRVKLDTGETEILITSLTDTTAYNFHLFMELYFERWPVEEDYKSMKCWLEVENFSGKSVLSIQQDFHAKIVSKNLTSALCSPARENVKRGSAGKQYVYQINFAQALSKTKDVIVLLFQKAKELTCQLIRKLNDIYALTIEPKRPGRKYPRNHKTYRRQYFLNYKPIR